MGDFWVVSLDLDYIQLSVKAEPIFSLRKNIPNILYRTDSFLL